MRGGVKRAPPVPVPFRAPGAAGPGRRWARGAARRRLDRWLYGLGNLVVYGPLQEIRLGRQKKQRPGCGRGLYRPAQPSGPKIFTFYLRRSAQPMKQLYGQTEPSVFVTIHPDARVFADHVGKPARAGSGSGSPKSCEVRSLASPGAFQGLFSRKSGGPPSTPKTAERVGSIPRARLPRRSDGNTAHHLAAAPPRPAS